MTQRRGKVTPEHPLVVLARVFGAVFGYKNIVETGEATGAEPAGHVFTRKAEI